MKGVLSFVIYNIQKYRHIPMNMPVCTMMNLLHFNGHHFIALPAGFRHEGHDMALYAVVDGTGEQVGVLLGNGLYKVTRQSPVATPVAAVLIIVHIFSFGYQFG